MEQNKQSATSKMVFEDVTTITLNFDALEEWRDNKKDNIPICGCLSLYEACGLMPFIQQYCDTDKKTIVAADNILCNFYTLQRIRNFINHIWETYSINLKDDQTVVWNDDKWGRLPHYPKKIKAVVRNSLNANFANFCPGLDDDLPDNVLVFRTFHEELSDPKEEKQNEK